MDALEILAEVSDAYRRLQTLSVTATHLVESGDENSGTKSHTRVRFLYEAPNKIRSEQLGGRGMLQVADGENLHTVFPRLPAGHGPRYSSVPATHQPILPHSFQSTFPITGNTVFLFAGIEENVESAEVLRQEDDCFVVSVRYAQPAQSSLIVHGASIFYWIHTDHRMVMRRHGTTGHRRPTEEEIFWSSHTIAVDNLSLNEDLPEEAFHFTPPLDGTSMRGGVSGSGGGGFIENSVDEAKRVEHSGSHSWDGDTLVEHSRWKMRGLLLQLERRLLFSADGTELRVRERINGPKGTVEGELVVPLA